MQLRGGLVRCNTGDRGSEGFHCACEGTDLQSVGTKTYLSFVVCCFYLFVCRKSKTLKQDRRQEPWTLQKLFLRPMKAVGSHHSPVVGGAFPPKPGVDGIVQVLDCEILSISMAIHHPLTKRPERPIGVFMFRLLEVH